MPLQAPGGLSPVRGPEAPEYAKHQSIGVRIPQSLQHLGTTELGRAWLDSLPKLYEDAVGRWSLRTDAPFSYAYASLAMPAVLPDGGEVVLKLSFPHRESEHEAEALRHWDGQGAIRLLDHDPASDALLLERCRPGTPLAEVAASEALDVVIELLSRLLVPVAQPFRALSDEAAWWASYLERRWQETGRPFGRSLLDAALDALAYLPQTQGPAVLVNQDLHAANVLRAAREPWLVIDPKPLAGEKEFGIASMVRGHELGHSRRQVLGRLHTLCSELGLDRERARAWALAQTVAWCFEDDGALPGHIDVATWLHEAG